MRLGCCGNTVYWFAGATQRREHDLQKARPDQAFWRDQKPVEIGVKRLGLGIEAGERAIDDMRDSVQRVFGWDAIFKVDITEQRSALLIRPANPRPAATRQRVNPVPKTASRDDFFSNHSAGAPSEHRRRDKIPECAGNRARDTCNGPERQGRIDKIGNTHIHDGS